MNQAIQQAVQTKDDEIAVAKLQRLISLNENLKQQEADFKASCKKQLGEMKNLIVNLQTIESNSEELQQYSQVNKALDVDREKFQKIKAVLSQKNREIALLQRKMDEIPVKIELTQYERRFTELYDQVSSKLDEHRKYITVYNTLSETLKFMESHLSLVNSIYDYFIKARDKNKSKEYRQWVTESVKKSSDAVEKSKFGVEKKMRDESNKRDSLAQKHQELVHRQRAYIRAVKELQDSYKQNEELKRKIKQLKK